MDKFIEETLIDISNGVINAMKRADVTIAPGRIEGKAILDPQMVKFEIETTISGEGGGKISVLPLVEINASGTGAKSHRLSFEVPVHFNSRNPLKED